MISQIFDLDQQYHADSDAAIEQLYLDGIADAIDGKYPYSREWEYLKGYGEGLKQVQARMRCELALLKGEASDFEALLAEPRTKSSRRLRP